MPEIFVDATEIEDNETQVANLTQEEIVKEEQIKLNKTLDLLEETLGSDL